MQALREARQGIRIIAHTLCLLDFRRAPATGIYEFVQYAADICMVGGAAADDEALKDARMIGYGVEQRRVRCSS